MNYIDRMREEEADLDDKICKLKTFIELDKYQELSAEEQNLLKFQLSAMELYTSILGIRIFNATV